jgi:phage/plasmid-like protein (TIGR03299 family)
MAHNLNYNEQTKKYSFAIAGEQSWHGLGQRVEDAMTSAEAIELAGLNYQVIKSPLQTRPDEEGSVSMCDTHVATMRTDTQEILGVVSTKYEIIQNVDCFNFFDEIIDKGEAIYQTAGALGKGERIFLTAKLPDDILVGGEKVENYFMLTNGHGGGHGLVAALTPIRVVCNNTLTAALKSCTNKVTIKHFKNATQRVKEAYKVMGMASKYLQEVEPIFNKMVDYKMTEGQVNSYIQSCFSEPQENGEYSTRTQNLSAEVLKFAMTHDTQNTIETKGTLWGAYNSISGYLGWVKDYKNAEARMKDINFGTGARQVQKAFDIATQLTKHL